ncbi:hypothetical protein F4819DRAFT_448693 [Hypoxylon fuscum]|nr:hypothetical protein F4819DRAFT_448693 [Hypoxylon fuscum]
MASPTPGLYVPAQRNEADDDDNISLTSTVYEDDDPENVDKDWVVEDLFAERPHPDRPGQMQYLIKWENWPMDQCTWEPEEHLGPGLLLEWDDKKKEIAAGQRLPFDIEIYNTALRERDERHARRHAKRKRLGLLLTEPEPLESSVQKPFTADRSTSEPSTADPFTSEPSTAEPVVAEPVAAGPSAAVVAEDELDPRATQEHPAAALVAEAESNSRAVQEHPAVAVVAEDKSDPRAKAQEANNNDPGHINLQKMEPKKVIKQKDIHVIQYEGPKAKANVGQNAKKKKPPPIQPSKQPSKPPQPIPAAKRTPSNTSNDGKASGTMTGYQGTARKPSISTNTSSASKRPPAQPPKISSSLASKFSGKKLTATRTRPLAPANPAPPVNVFTGGKERKKRTGLGDVMGDSSTAPRAFKNMRMMNIAKKRGIEKKDTAHVELSSIPSSFILTDHKNKRPKEDSTKANVPSTPASAPVSAPPESPAMVQSPMAISPGDSSAAGPAYKAKRKAVRFNEAKDAAPEDELMTDVVDNIADPIINGKDDVDFPSADSGSVRASSPSAPKRLSLTNYYQRGQTQVVSKKAVFGKLGSDPIRVVLSGITRQNQPWLSAFIDQETLNFDAICVSYNFMSNRPALIGEILSVGVVESASKEILAALTNVAEHLRRGSYGCHLVTEQYSILVYPSRCQGWDELSNDIDKQQSESPLRHMIYKSPIDARLYPPTSTTRAAARLRQIDQGPLCRVLIQDLLELDFSQFLPQHPKERDKQVFMLLFPEREMQVCNMVKVWLRSWQPDCRIFSCEIDDSWPKFHEAVRAGQAGTVIFHEDVSASIRKIPRMLQMIENKRCYTFWDLATGQYNPPRFPSDVSSTIAPGTLQMTRLFPHGRAFLITPSFALSDPIRLCQFLEWFKYYCHNPHYLIMACADFPEYLKAVTLEKEREREAICAREKDNPVLEELLAGLGLGKADLKARFQAWEILQDIMEQFGDEETSEEIRKVEWITEFIDPNDEQSLVNWFCWWSTLKCDHYRKFSVLGSNNSKIKAAYRKIDVPAYTAEAVGDPDVALAREDQQRRAREVAEDERGFSQDVLANPGPTNSASTTSTPVSRTAPVFQSNMFKSGRAMELRGWITDLFIRSRPAPWVRLHANPVSWLNVAMADRFGDPRCEYDTFKNWIGHAPKLSNGINTWYGLFYTIDQGWNPLVAPNSYERHPWIAVLRPINPHHKTFMYKEMELFIWDLSAHDRRRASVRSSLLLNMQRRLVDMVREEIPLRNSHFFLDKVYVSSMTDLVYKQGDNTLDITCQWLQKMMVEGKTWLPPFESLLPDRGWIELQQSDWRGGMAVSSSASSPAPQQTQPFLRNASDENKFPRSIWHAPRPNAKVGKSKCVNHLYEAASEARMADKSCQKIKYQYRSTLDWYHDMKAEGRDSSHVHVDSAERILHQLRQKK